jgi:hypothetical protein
MEDLHPERRTGYRYETDLESQLEASSKRYDDAIKLGNKGLWQKEHPVLTKEQVAARMEELSPKVEKILESQEASGAWITKNDRFKKTLPRGERWNGQYNVMDRISSEVFNQNVDILCEYIELSNLLDQF